MNRGELMNGFTSPPLLVSRVDARGTSKELPASTQVPFRFAPMRIPVAVVRNSV
jgi:hypothetical protein